MTCPAESEECKSVQVSDIAYASSSNCQTMTIVLEGQTDRTTLLTELEALDDGDHPYWTSDSVVSIMQKTDGYKITVNIDLVVAGDIDTSNTNGMCFGHEPATYGGYCITWVGDGVTAGAIARKGFAVQYIPSSSWSGSNWPGSSAGTALDIANSGLQLSPETTERATCPDILNCNDCVGLPATCIEAYPPILADEDGMAVGAKITATWYLPVEADEYSDLTRISARDTV